MKRIFAIILIIIWIPSGILTYGITFAYFHNEYDLWWLKNAPEKYGKQLSNTKGTATIFALSGPFGLFVSYLSSGFAYYGIQFKEKPNEHP